MLASLLGLAAAAAVAASTPDPSNRSARVAAWTLPVESAAAQPNLVESRGVLFLSWIESDGGDHRLRFARDPGDGFDAARDIARGTDWFVNWADFPAFVVLPDGTLAAHFLQKSAAAPYAYDVRLTRSDDDGRTWSMPTTVHDDGTTTEHGFASLFPWSAHELGIAWLDGRDGGDDHHAHGGAMSLRGAVFERDAKRAEWQLDTRTCDCCQTDVALAAGGPVLVYRDRDDNEIRDIAITRYRAGRWSAPVRVHADDWKMPACPVNGPAVAARGNDVHVAWYTGAGDEPQLRLAYSADDGAGFAPPRMVARGDEVQGRVDVARSGDHVFVSWLSEDAGAQTLWLARYPVDLAGAPRRVAVARLARGRATGFPRMALRGGVAYLVWTDIVERAPRLRGATVEFGG